MMSNSTEQKYSLIMFDKHSNQVLETLYVSYRFYLKDEFQKSKLILDWHMLHNQLHYCQEERDQVSS